MKKQIFFTVIILFLILAGMALSAVPTETWHGLKIFADGFYVKDANTVVIDPNNGITSSKPFNNITITAPANSATLTIADGKTATFKNSIAFYGTDSTEITLPAVNSTLLGTNASDIAATKHLQPATDDTYYIGKNDDDTPAAYKGLILKDTTNGKYYRVEITSGTIYATDLTD